MTLEDLTREELVALAHHQQERIGLDEERLALEVDTRLKLTRSDSIGAALSTANWHDGLRPAQAIVEAIYKTEAGISRELKRPPIDRVALLGVTQDVRAFHDAQELRYGGRVLKIIAHKGYPEDAEGHFFPLDKGHSGRAVSLGMTVHVSEVAKSPYYTAVDRFVAGSELAIPITNDVTQGALVLTSSVPHAFRNIDIAHYERACKLIGNWLQKIDLANRDVLTNLFTRKRFLNDLERDFLRSYMQESELGLVMLDINALKHANDTNGHDAGDAYLRAVVAGMSDVSRASDCAYRYGADELVILLHGASYNSPSNNGTRTFALERLRPAICARVSALVKDKGYDLPAHEPVSIGWTSMRSLCDELGGRRHVTSTGMITEADEHMYRSKQKFKEENPGYNLRKEE